MADDKATDVARQVRTFSGLVTTGLGGTGLLVGRQMIKDEAYRAKFKARHGFDAFGPSKLAERGPLSMVRGRVGGVLTMAGGALMATTGIEMIAPGAIFSKANAATPAAAPTPAKSEKDQGEQGSNLGALRVGAGAVMTTLGGSGMLIGRQMIKDARAGYPTSLGPLKGGRGGALTLVGGALLAGAGIETMFPGSMRSKANAATPVSAAPTPAPTPPSTVSKVVDTVTKPENILTGANVVLSSMATVQAAKILTKPAARAAAGLLSKAFVPLTVGLAVWDGIQGYQKDGIQGAATGVADSLTGGAFSLVKDHLLAPSQPAVALSPPQALVSDRLAVAQDAANRTAGEMGQATTMNQGSMRPAGAEVSSDGNTDQYMRMQNGRRVTVSSYKTPTR